jgi:hypothetical protein
MFLRIATPLCLMLLAVAGAVANASPARAGQVGSFVINNSTNATINYVLRWSSGEETTIELGPGSHWASFYEVDANGRIPTPTVTFDSVGGDDAVTPVTYELDALLLEEENFLQGKDYTFKYDSSGVLLDLYEG